MEERKNEKLPMKSTIMKLQISFGFGYTNNSPNCYLMQYNLFQQYMLPVKFQFHTKSKDSELFLKERNSIKVDVVIS